MSTLERDKARYLAALHAMQSGVAFTPADQPMPGFVSRECTPKHLRVGVNSALVGSGALLRVLIAKGICTEEEFTAALADQAEEEVANYERELTALLGKPVKLG
ncbi:hypothetical protein BA190_26775 [Labrys sp. WJW]|uniref:hypothetical protein n=1 Tax=Labrys sp. WJW TaxID=1737983 RepID=UPI00082CF831|nr:hypothetical protein [Labrys sp. WJW]OCC01819.1 hypothetical protein BA190_26775 [Labrys sp. WJW]